jgi:hypothetical protein
MEAPIYVKRSLLWLMVVTTLLVLILLYRSRPGDNLNVDPHAREVIEKAKRR